MFRQARRSSCGRMEYESRHKLYCYGRRLTASCQLSDNVLHLAQEKSTKLFYLSGDVTSADSVSQMFAKAVGLSRFPLRGLVTCAGISGECPAISYPLQAIQRIMDVNYYGTFMVAQAAAKEMRKQNVPGSMVLVASMSGTNSNKVRCSFHSFMMLPTYSPFFVLGC